MNEKLEQILEHFFGHEDLQNPETKDGHITGCVEALYPIHNMVELGVAMFNEFVPYLDNIENFMADRIVGFHKALVERGLQNRDATQIVSAMLSRGNNSAKV